MESDIMNKECLFCKIASGDIPSYKIYEDEIVIAFLDINPDSNGHTLIIPKKHYLDMNDIPLDTLTHIFKIAKELKVKIESKLNADGLTFVQNNGDIQEVKHFHLHLKPYYKDNELKSVEEIYNILKDRD